MIKQIAKYQTCWRLCIDLLWGNKINAVGDKDQDQNASGLVREVCRRKYGGDGNVEIIDMSLER